MSAPRKTAKGRVRKGPSGQGPAPAPAIRKPAPKLVKRRNYVVPYFVDKGEVYYFLAVTQEKIKGTSTTEYTCSTLGGVQHPKQAEEAGALRELDEESVGYWKPPAADIFRLAEIPHHTSWKKEFHRFYFYPIQHEDDLPKTLALHRAAMYARAGPGGLKKDCTECTFIYPFTEAELRALPPNPDIAASKGKSRFDNVWGCCDQAPGEAAIDTFETGRAFGTITLYVWTQIADLLDVINTHNAAIRSRAKPKS